MDPQFQLLFVWAEPPGPVAMSHQDLVYRREEETVDANSRAAEVGSEINRDQATVRHSAILYSNFAWVDRRLRSSGTWVDESQGKRTTVAQIQP